MNPPAPLTSIVERLRELSEVRQVLGQARLVTLTRVGGVGKTRRALAVDARSTLTGEYLAACLGP